MNPIDDNSVDNNPMEKILSNVPRATKNLLQSYAKLVVDWNLHLNLTGAKSLQEFILDHILDCAKAFEALSPQRLWIDVGSGSGLPGLVWAILQPSQKFLLVEVSQKKISFLRRAHSALQLKNLEVFHGRFENLTKGVLEKFSKETPHCVSRGTSAPADLLQLAKSSLVPWESWVVFSNEKTWTEFLTRASKFDMEVERLSYLTGPKEDPLNLGVLTILKKKN